MARVNFTLEHHQPTDVARARFEAGIDEAVSRYRSWIGTVDWSEDGQAATISGSGYEVRLWYDERFLHVQGRVPLAWKIFEGAVRHRIGEMIARPA
jgi:hypothetical protein